MTPCRVLWAELSPVAKDEAVAVGEVSVAGLRQLSVRCACESLNWRPLLRGRDGPDIVWSQVIAELYICANRRDDEPGGRYSGPLRGPFPHSAMLT